MFLIYYYVFGITHCKNYVLGFIFVVVSGAGSGHKTLFWIHCPLQRKVVLDLKFLDLNFERSKLISSNLEFENIG